MENVKNRVAAVLMSALMSMAVWWMVNKKSPNHEVTKVIEKKSQVIKKKVNHTSPVIEEKINHTSQNNKSHSGNKRKVIPTVVVGPSGVGKGTLLARVKEEFSGCFAVAVSHTTRAPRPGETDGVSYNFVSREKFKSMVANNEFIEHAEFGENMYGTSVKAVADVADSGKICLLEIDVQGAESIKSLGMKARFIFITTSGDTLSILSDRLLNRGTESKEKIEKRLSTARRELNFLDDNREFFDFVLENDELEASYRQLSSKLRTWYQLQPSN